MPGYLGSGRNPGFILLLFSSSSFVDVVVDAAILDDFDDDFDVAVQFPGSAAAESTGSSSSSLPGVDAAAVTMEEYGRYCRGCVLKIKVDKKQILLL